MARSAWGSGGSGGGASGGMLGDGTGGPNISSKVKDEPAEVSVAELAAGAASDWPAGASSAPHGQSVATAAMVTPASALHVLGEISSAIRSGGGGGGGGGRIWTELAPRGPPR